MPRECEPKCAIFANVPGLAKIAASTAGDPLAAFEHQIDEEICQHCKLSASPGDYCNEHLARTCPLSVYAADVLAALEPIVVRHGDVKE